MARQRDQAARRDQVLQATLETIASRGLSGTTLRNIADAAGVSPRLVPYYYPDFDGLVEAAHQVATERYYVARRAVIDTDTDAGTKLGRLMYTGLPRGRDRLLSQVLNELSVNASRSRRHAALMTDLFDREVSLYRSVLEEGLASGELALTEPPEVVARNFVALEDAYGLHLLGRNSSVDLARAELAMASYARVVTGTEVRPQAATG